MANDESLGQLRFETNLSPAQLLQLLPEIAARTGLRIEHVHNPIIHIHIGEAAMDSRKRSDITKTTVGDITGSTIGAIGSARDVTVFCNRVDASDLSEDLKRELKEARRRIDELELDREDKDDITDNLTKLTTELQKPEKQQDEGRLKRYFTRIKESAPAIASGLSITASILKLTGHL